MNASDFFYDNLPELKGQAGSIEQFMDFCDLSREKKVWNKLDSRFVDIEDSEALKKVGLIKKEELRERIKGLVDKWEGERIDNTIYRLSGEELNNMRLDDLEEILKILD